MLAVPRGGPPMQLTDDVWVAAGEFGAQVLAEQVVVPVGPSIRVERDDEQGAAFELAEQLPAVSPPGDRSAQRGGELVQHARAQKEVDDVRRVTGQDVFAEEVGDVSARSGKALQEFVRLGS